MAIFTIIFLLLLCAILIYTIREQNREAGLRELKITSPEKRATELANDGAKWQSTANELQDEVKAKALGTFKQACLFVEEQERSAYWRKQCQTERTRAGKAHLTPPWERK